MLLHFPMQIVVVLPVCALVSAAYSWCSVTLPHGISSVPAGTATRVDRLQEHMFGVTYNLYDMDTDEPKKRKTISYKKRRGRESRVYVLVTCRRNIWLAHYFTAMLIARL